MTCVCVCVCVCLFFSFSFLFWSGQSPEGWEGSHEQVGRTATAVPTGDAIGRMGGRRNEMVKTDLRSTLDRRW